MKKILNYILDLIYKKKCYFCGSSKENVSMCSECFEDISYSDIKIERTFNNVDIYCACEYSDNVQKLIRGLKYHNKPELAYYQAKIMFEYWNKLNFNSKFQIVPVPLHKNRKKKRKYNHMELVAEEFCKLTGYETNFELIKRTKDTKPQYKLSKKERMENLKNAFQIDKTKLQEDKILLLDDICTTGSTFESIIQELNKNGITDIVCFATSSPRG